MGRTVSTASANEIAALDASDPLASLREAFAIPEHAPGQPVVYLCGNSLGLMPQAARTLVDEELDAWAQCAVEAHFKEPRPWFSYHELFRESAARLVGAEPDEVVMMNTLTVNLHLMMASFYRPGYGRDAILIEQGAFPSDRYAVESQVVWHGRDPDDAILEVGPRPGEEILRTEDVLDVLDRQGARIALVMLGGVNYFTGQYLDIPEITRAAHAAGSMVGWDLAHAAGNVPLRLHDWDVDFAVWCSYKYLNAGPGAVAGCFVHRRHGRDPSRPRLTGWWGNDPATRFHMHEVRHFVPREGADGWQVSNPPILSLAPLRASLDLFDRAGMAALRAKSERLTGMLDRLLRDTVPGVTILTPQDPAHRGCQLSLRLETSRARPVFERLVAEGIVGDFREPDVIRLAPTPLYNTFADVQDAADGVRRALEALGAGGEKG